MNHWFWVLMVFTVLMGLSICVCVHGPLVLGFGSFHSFDGPVHLCVCTYGPPVLGFNSQEKIVAFTMYCLLYDEHCEYIHYCKFYKTNTSNGNCNVNFTLLLFTIVE